MILTVSPVQGELEFGIPTPMQLPPFNEAGGYGYPWLSEDQLDIYVTTDYPSSEPYTTGAFDIWTSHRDSVSDPWQPLVNLGSPVNTPELSEIGSSLTADGRELYFFRALSPFGLPEGDLYVSNRQPDNSL